MGRSIAAVLIGVVIGAVMIQWLEWAGHLMLPAPVGVDLSDPQQLARYMAELPVSVLLFVLLAWFFGVIDGAIIAAWLAPARPWLHAAIVAVVLATAALITLCMVPHPLWFLLATPMVYVLAWAIGGRIGCMLHDRRRAGIAR